MKQLFATRPFAKLNALLAIALCCVALLSFYLPYIILRRQEDSSQTAHRQRTRAGILVSYAYYEKDAIQVSNNSPC